MLYEIDAGNLIDFARRWADLGVAAEFRALTPRFERP
jgi:hypothetical protein